MRNVLKTQFNKKVGALLTCVAWLCFAAPVPAAPGDVDPLNANVVGSFVVATAVQPDGKTIIGGNFTSVLGQPRNHIARLNADGTLDAGFNPNAGNVVNCVTVQADGGILLGGNFTTVGGTARNRIARVDAAGALDAGFNPNANGLIFSVAMQADGKILLGGVFTAVGGIARNSIARVDAAGAVDAGFNPNVDNIVRSVAVQADGRILLGGHFLSVGGTARFRIARVDAAGVLEAGFNPAVVGNVFSVAVQADGRILLGGNFTDVDGTARNLFARLINDHATQTLSAPDATQVTWTRGGSSPEVSLVTFEKSTDSGATWTPLGNGTRIGTTPTWQLTGLALPGAGQIRARGRTNGSSSLIEQVATFSFLTPLEMWRQSWFGTTANAGDAADTFDYDLDGLVNLVEYAFGLNPTSAGSAQLPPLQWSGGTPSYNFTQPDGISGITYGAEWSTTLLPGSWTTIPDTGIAPQHHFSVPTVSGTRQFFRLWVTSP